MQETGVQPLGGEDPPEKGTATHSSIHAWEMPWTEEAGRLQSRGLQTVGQDLATKQQQHKSNGGYNCLWLGCLNQVNQGNDSKKISRVAVCLTATDPHSKRKMEALLKNILDK